MANPQKELFKMLAESNLRMGHMKRVHGKHLEAIPAKQDAVMAQLNQLRSQILADGVGRNREAENKYLELLEHQRYLDQSYDMGQLRKPQSAIPAELQKSIDYGMMLIAIYDGGALVKGAAVDLLQLGQWLKLWDYPLTQAVGDRLIALAKTNF